MSDWRKSLNTGDLLLVTDAKSVCVGHCWMQGRLKKGDIALCVGHSGDGFHDFFLVDASFSVYRDGKYIPSARLIMESRFGAYEWGGLLDYKLSARDYHLLMAGETISFPGNIQSSGQKKRDGENQG